MRMMKKIFVGCCGWATGRERYFKKFSTVEIQSTFYRLPELKTVKGWRDEAPEGFVFCMKAWQAVTHPPSSPTWRRSGLKPEEIAGKEYGWLRPTKDNLAAWEMTRGICEELGARVCVLQCPPSFRYSGENMKNMKKLLSSVKRERIIIGWEPRGDWGEHPEEVRKLCQELDLTHVVDPLRGSPLHLGSGRVAYFRLHGFGKPSIYNYRYSEAELRELAKICEEIKAREVYCMLNNIHMLEDAERLRRLLEKI